VPLSARNYGRMSASTHMNLTDRVIHGFVCVAVRLYVPVCRPAPTDYYSIGFDPVTRNSHHSVGGSFWNRN